MTWDDVRKQLADWRSEPERYADAGVEPPTLAAIDSAERLVGGWTASPTPPPDSMGLDPNGGVVLEWQRLGEFHVWEDGEWTYVSQPRNQS
jgi:hypothetical protein